MVIMHDGGLPPLRELHKDPTARKAIRWTLLLLAPLILLLILMSAKVIDFALGQDHARQPASQATTPYLYPNQ